MRISAPTSTTSSPGTSANHATRPPGISAGLQHRDPRRAQQAIDSGFYRGHPTGAWFARSLTVARDACRAGSVLFVALPMNALLVSTTDAGACAGRFWLGNSVALRAPSLPAKSEMSPSGYLPAVRNRKRYRTALCGDSRSSVAPVDPENRMSEFIGNIPDAACIRARSDAHGITPGVCIPSLPSESGPIRTIEDSCGDLGRFVERPSQRYNGGIGVDLRAQAPLWRILQGGGAPTTAIRAHIPIPYSS